MQDRLDKGRETLEAAREAFGKLCEQVAMPKSELDHIRYFCGNSEQPQDLAETEPLRVALYKCVAILMRSYAAIAEDIEQAQYTPQEAANIAVEVERAIALRDVIRFASGEHIELKAYEADMRYLIDTYIKAEEARKISHFDDVGLLDLIVKSGIADAVNSLPSGVSKSKSAVAETIANNVRRAILQQRSNNPAFYDKMSEVLDDVIAKLRDERLDYEQFMQEMAELAARVRAGMSDNTPVALDTAGKRALYNNLKDDEELALKIDAAVRRSKPADFRGNRVKENIIKQAIYPLLNDDVDEVERIFQIITAQQEY